MANSDDELYIKQKFSEVMEDNMTTMTVKKSNRIDWYYAPAFLLFWLCLFFAVVLPLFLHLPKGLTLANEKQHQGKFIAERAEIILYKFDQIGPKVTGSDANENVTVQLLHHEVEEIRRQMHHDLYDLEVDVQVVSGAYMHWTMINMYQGVQNFVVKLSCKNSTSENYLLINSHFDSKVGSPGTGDDGAMVVIMLEVLRVLATNRDTFQHPIVFLFNGAEENPLQASHGFITQHKWAKKCKALINLDSAGSGNREILFQSGPNHPWLMKLYNKHAIRPFASTLGEELFQSGIIASDTDFRIFRDYGHVPGLDFAHFYNGYVYHTKFDKFENVPRGTLQATGDNILSLAKAFANAPEMEDTEKYSEGHSVFYDFLGIFFICYTETQGKIINACMSVIVLTAVGISMRQISILSFVSFGRILIKFALIIILHSIGIALAIGLPILIAVLLDSGDFSMSWFANKWLDKLRMSFEIQLFQHAHAVIFAILCIVTTFLGFRSSYIFFLILFFYGAALILNIISTLYRRGNLWCIIIILGQILPFIYLANICYILLTVLVPMMAYGYTNNPDLLIGGLCAICSIISMGFLIPMWNIFRHLKLLLLSFLFITFIFSMIAITPIGFPYRPKTHVGRIHYLNVNRVFYEYNGSVSKNESGYYFDWQSRRLHYPKTENTNMSEMETLFDDCKDYMMCGLPLFNHRMVKTSKNGMWFKSKVPIELPATPKLTMLNKTFNVNNSSSRYEFELSGPPHMSIFVQPLEGVTVLDWTFLKPMLQDRKKYKPPYHIYFTYGKLSTPLKFYFDLKINNKTLDNPLFELGISGHYISSEYSRGKDAQEFIKQFPDYVFVMEWPSSYERYLF